MNSCTAPGTANSSSLTWFRSRNKHYTFVSKGKSWSSKPICHWLCSETRLMLAIAQSTPHSWGSSRHTDQPLVSFNTQVLYFAHWSSSWKRKRKKKAWSPGSWSSSKVVSILTVISNRSKAKPESSDYLLQNPSISISKQKDQISWLRQTVVSVPIFINTRYIKLRRRSARKPQWR